jgi:opacity protein-like surface antigen
MRLKRIANSISALMLLAALLAVPINGSAAGVQIQDQDRTTAPDQVQEQLQGQVEGHLQGSDQGQSRTRGGNPPTAAELVTDYLRQDIFLRPGVGLEKVKIGTPFTQVLKVWGRPTGKGGGISGNEWTYQLGGSTKITLSGDSKVKTMEVTGGLSCPYVTTEGASFGMAVYQLATIYGSAPVNSGTVTYDHRGIGFVLDHGQVSGIQLFAPR